MAKRRDIVPLRKLGNYQPMGIPSTEELERIVFEENRLIEDVFPEEFEAYKYVPFEDRCKSILSPGAESYLWGNHELYAMSKEQVDARLTNFYKRSDRIVPYLGCLAAEEARSEGVDILGWNTPLNGTERNFAEDQARKYMALKTRLYEIPGIITMREE